MISNTPEESDMRGSTALIKILDLKCPCSAALQMQTPSPKT